MWFKAQRFITDKIWNCLPRSRQYLDVWNKHINLPTFHMKWSIPGDLCRPIHLILLWIYWIIKMECRKNWYSFYPVQFQFYFHYFFCRMSADGMVGFCVLLEIIRVHATVTGSFVYFLFITKNNVFFLTVV